MRKTFLSSLLILIVSSFTQAQRLEKGTKLVGLSGIYANVSGSGIGLISGSYLGMLNSSVALGGNLTFVTGGNASVAILGPALRAYLTSQGSSRVFVGGNLGINTSTGSASYNGVLGLSNFINDHVAVDIAATYGNTANNNSISTSSSVNIFTIQLGFQIFLPKK